MNWNAIGAVGQIMGSLATFVTVGYLAVQVHNGETDSRRALAQTRMQRTLDMAESMVSNRSLTDVELKFINAILSKNVPAVPASSTYTGMQSFIGAVMQHANVSMEDAYPLVLHYSSVWNTLSDTIIHRDELLPADRLDFDQSLRDGLGNPGFAFWYRTFKPSLVQQAVSYVDSLNLEVGKGQSLLSPVKAAQSDAATPSALAPSNTE